MAKELLTKKLFEKSKVCTKLASLESIALKGKDRLPETCQAVVVPVVVVDVEAGRAKASNNGLAL